MLVCGHGDVRSYCETRGMIIACTHVGDLEDYNGVCKVVVTDMEMSESEYYFIKGKMLAKGYELVSTRYGDNTLAATLIEYYARKENEDKKKYGGRCKFGFKRVNGEIVPHEERMVVVRRILELKDRGCTLREIQSDEIVRHTDGRELSLSTIQLIIKNRKEYEEDV